MVNDAYLGLVLKMSHLLSKIKDYPTPATDPECVEEFAFRSAILAEPRRPFLWLVYADWLEDNCFDDQGSECRQRAAQLINPKLLAELQKTIE